MSSISSEITRINGNIADAYTAVSAKGGTLPAQQNSDHLSNAIQSIEVGITPAGNIQLTQQSDTDVTNYATASVRSGSLSLNTPTINTSTGVVTASASLSTSGWVGSAPSSTTLSLTTQGAKTVTPGTSSQTAVAAGRYTTGAVTVAAVPSEDKTVSLSMASGDQTVNASSGKWMTSVTVSKPATLLPENIKENVNIAGVIGTYVGGTAVTSTDFGDGTQGITITDDGSAISLPAKTITQNGVYNPVDDGEIGYGTVTVSIPIPAGKAAQASDSMGRVNTTALSSTSVAITVEKTGTYTVRWYAYRTSTSGTSGTRLYIGSTAYETENTTFSVNNNGQTNNLTGVSLTAGQTITVYARARSTSYYTFVMGLSIIEE